MRLAFGEIAQECNTFTPQLTTLADYQRTGLHFGEAVLTEHHRAENMLQGMIQAVETYGGEIVPILATHVGPYGRVEQATFEFLKAKLIDGLRAELPVDGVFLAFHGAMVAEHEDDPEGNILAVVRELVGPDVPVTAGFDMHANITRRIAGAANAITLYHTHPHVDQPRTGFAATEILIRSIRGEVRPTMAIKKIPMITPSENRSTLRGPMKEIMARVVEIDRSPGVLAASLGASQPWLDIEEMGWTAVVVTDDDPSRAQQYADEIAELAWSKRREFLVKKTLLAEAIDRARQTEGLVVFCDANDSTNSGGTGDTTAILRALVECEFPRLAMLPMVDPESVEQVIAAGVRSEVDLAIGGKMHEISGGPVRARARVHAIADGIFTIKAPQGRGRRTNCGRMVNVSVGNVHVVMSEHSTPGHDPQVYRHVGLEPEDARIVVVKSPVAYRASYEPIARLIIDVDTPGLSTSNLASLPWKKVPRPLFPIDDM